MNYKYISSAFGSYRAFFIISLRVVYNYNLILYATGCLLCLLHPRTFKTAQNKTTFIIFINLYYLGKTLLGIFG